MANNVIKWFENSLFDAPELKSPQPCIHGAGCVYTKKTADGKVIPAVCSFVHPGEEGKGRRLFPARTVTFEHPDGKHVVAQPACVRLIGNALYYERMRMQMPWQGFCAVRGIPFTANVPGVLREPVRRVPIGSPRVVPTKNEQRQHEIVGNLVSIKEVLSSLMGPAPLSAVATAGSALDLERSNRQAYQVLLERFGNTILSMSAEIQELHKEITSLRSRYSDIAALQDCLAEERAGRVCAVEQYMEMQKEFIGARKLLVENGLVTE
jgi:hypothetical protein